MMALGRGCERLSERELSLLKQVGPRHCATFTGILVEATFTFVKEKAALVSIAHGPDRLSD